jgi:hypothetical protein
MGALPQASDPQRLIDVFAWCRFELDKALRSAIREGRMKTGKTLFALPMDFVP